MGNIFSEDIKEDAQLMKNIENACQSNIFPCCVVFIQDSDGVEEVPYSEQMAFEECEKRALFHLHLARLRFRDFDFKIETKKKISMGPTVAKTTFTISKKL